MKKRLVITCLIVLFIGIISALGAQTTNDPEAWEHLLPYDIERVKSGEIIVRPSPPIFGVKSYGVIAAFIVDVNIDEAYRILREAEKQVEFTKVLMESNLIERTDTYDIVEFKLKFLGRIWVYRTRHEWNDSKYHTWWTLDTTFDNDFAQFDGSYGCFSVDENHTLVRYSADLNFKEYFPKTIQQ